MRTTSYILVLLLVFFASCRQGGSRLLHMSEDKVAKQLLQGVWVDDASDMPFFLVAGDSLLYAGQDATPMAFKIIRDSIYLLGIDTISYKIERQGENTFWIRTDTDDIVKLYRSEDAVNEYAFRSNQKTDEVNVVQKKMQKDSIIVYDGVRYRGYVFINPSKYKVIRTSLDDNGMAIERVYYDNIIHICVYEGAHELYGRDIDKKLFANYMDAEVLPVTILSDMDFIEVDAEGYHYRAILTIPESSVTYNMSLTISPQGQLQIAPEES